MNVYLKPRIKKLLSHSLVNKIIQKYQSVEEFFFFLHEIVIILKITNLSYFWLSCTNQEEGLFQSYELRHS